MATSPRFVAPEFQHMFVHAVNYRLSHGNTCPLCVAAKYCVLKTVGWMLRSLILTEERHLAGSNAVAVKMGQMTANMAAVILDKESYHIRPIEPAVTGPELRNETDHTVARKRMSDMLCDDFPGIDIYEHIGGDIPSHAGNYVPFLRHSNMLYTSLKTIYQATVTVDTSSQSVPSHLITSFLVLCAHFCGTLTINIDTLRTLFSESLLTDTVVLLKLLQ